MTTARTLMAGLVDYAGLFPPAALDMAAAVRRYRDYLAGPDRWALGKFVVPVTRLTEFSAVFNEMCCSEREPVWGLSLLSSGDAACDVAGIAELAPGALAVDAIEVKAASQVEAEKFLEQWEAKIPAYVEFSPAIASSMLPMLARFGARAKIRAGGMTAEAIPSVEAVADFLLTCAREQVPFKATAGLHHVVRGVYKLTYEVDSASAAMHGFANVFLAAALAWHDADKEAVLETLAVSQALALAFGDESVRWLRHEIGINEIAATRREFAVSYGSCSFTEPIEEARAAGWL